MRYQLPRLAYLLIGLIFFIELFVLMMFKPGLSTEEGTNIIYVLAAGVALAFFLWLEPWRWHDPCSLFHELGMEPFVDRLGELSSRMAEKPCGQKSVGKAKVRIMRRAIDLSGQEFVEPIWVEEKFCSLHHPELPRMQEWLKANDIKIYPQTIKIFRFIEDDSS